MRSAAVVVWHYRIKVLWRYNQTEEMKKSNFNYNNEYYNSPSRSRYSSRSSRRLHSECGSRQSINSKNRFYHRVEKACTTFSSNDVRKEVYLYRKEIERLEKQILKKDKVIFQLRESNMHNKQLETELIQVYRVLYMYQGKMDEYQKQLKKLEIAISSKMPSDVSQQVEELLESYRVENNELSGELQQKNRVIMDLEGKLKRTENKYFSTAWKLSSTKRQISNPLKKRFPNLRNTITLNQTPLIEKEKNFKAQTKALNAATNSEYQINDLGKNKQTFKFNKVQAPNFPEYRATLGQNSSRGQALRVSGRVSGSQEYFSFANNNSNNISGSFNQLDANNQSSRSLKFATVQNPPTSIKPVGGPPSNTNLSSQMTISNVGPGRRVEVREYRTNSPNTEFRRSTATFDRYAIGRNLNQIQNMVREGQSRVGSIGAGTNITGQSIYLK